jgi:hypothetical protein
MNRKTDNELLNDVLAENAPADFREALLGETLRLVRRQRRLRQARNAIGIVAVLVLLGILVWPGNNAKNPVAIAPPAVKAAQKNYTVIVTQPLATGNVITTHSLAATQFIGSKTSIEIVQTTAGNYRLIGDEELLALLGSHSAALVRVGPHSEKLVFANPADAKGFPVN